MSVTVDKNRPPLPRDDIISTDQGWPVTIEVLKNDTEPDGHEMAVTEVAGPDNGTAATDGTTVTYTPDQGFLGTDRFMYIITDGTKTNKGLISVTVAGDNTPDG